MRIETNVLRLQLSIEEYVQKHRDDDDPELQTSAARGAAGNTAALRETDPVQSCRDGRGRHAVIYCTATLNYRALVDLPTSTAIWAIRWTRGLRVTQACFSSACRGCTSRPPSCASPRTPSTSLLHLGARR